MGIFFFLVIFWQIIKTEEPFKRAILNFFKGQVLQVLFKKKKKIPKKHQKKKKKDFVTVLFQKGVLVMVVMLVRQMVWRFCCLDFACIF